MTSPHARSSAISRLARLSTLASAAVLAPALAAGPALADPSSPEPPGRVCMFLAPENVFGLGHVGWAYRHADGKLWDYGATSYDERPWRASNSLEQMLSDFRNREAAPSSFLYFRCRSTAEDDEAAAKAAADTSDSEPYNLITSNCLTRSLRIFHAYDGSADLASLGSGLLTAPRWYFDHDLDGFEPQARL